MLGAAFDFEVRFLLDPAHSPVVAMLRFAGQRGHLQVGSALDRLVATRRFGDSDLLSLAPADALRQLAELRAIAEVNLL
jgi:hypothetical protein